MYAVRRLFSREAVEEAGWNEAIRFRDAPALKETWRVM